MSIPTPDIDDFIDCLPRSEKVIVKHLRDLIMSIDPRIQGKLSYGVPYFFRNRRVLFLWPASAVPECASQLKRPKPPLVTLGFCYGKLLSNVQGILDVGKRTQVATVPLNNLSEVDEKVLTEMFFEAMLIDDQFKRKSK